MSIQNEINRIIDKRNQALTKVASKGVTVPSGSTIDDLPSLIDLIEVEQTYSITKTLSNVTSSNNDEKVIAGGSFYADLIPTSGYAITNIVITMGGVDVTEQVFKPGVGGKGITANGVYNASDDALSGYDRVVVNVPPVPPVLGTKTIVSNGTYTASSDSLDGYSEVTVNVPTGSSPTGTKSISITSNGTTTEDVTNYANAEITVAVSNSYTASDEGKVVSNGALVSQTSDTVTSNGMVDTTLISSLLVNVASGGGGLKYETGIFTLASNITVGSTPYAISHSLGIAPSVVIVFPKNTPTQSGDPARGYIWLDKPMGESTQYLSSSATSSYPLCVNYYVSDFGPPLKTRANIPTSSSYLLNSASKPTATHFYLYRQASSTVFYAGDYRYFICDKWW